MRKIVLSILACAAVCACTSEKISTIDNQKTFDGDLAYIVVSINDVGTSTRATSSGYEYGSESEYAVSDAHFYFYDDSGVIVAEGNKWDSETGSASTDDPAGTIEFGSEVILMLSGLTNMNYPAYIVTVLNKPSDFTPANTLAGLEAQLASESTVGIQNASDYFAMSTSSYGTSAYYFATAVSEANFTEEPVAYDETTGALNCTPVEIYVERLAAKVSVVSSLGTADVTLDDGTLLYELEGLTFDEVEETPRLYVSLDGWKLNATAKMSYMMKNIDTGWENTASSLGTDWTWNDAANFRSYWAMSPNYGDDLSTTGGYPTTSDGNTDADEAGAGDNAPLNEYLTYTSLNTGVNAIDTGYEYCGENTNTAGEYGVLSSKNSSAITSVLVKATLWEEVTADDGTVTYVTPTLVRFEGVLFSENAYLAYALNHLAASGELNVYYVSDTIDDEPVYSQIDASLVELAENVDGYVDVVLNDDGLATTWYSYTEGAGDGGENLTPIDVNDVQEILGGFNTYAYNDGNGGANGYLDGSMYYNVPIEHLNNGTATNSDGETVLAEANYGVVRNHHYNLTITSISNIGKGIYDPEEVIIPDKDFETYYIGAQINILSWRYVDQEVNLQ